MSGRAPLGVAETGQTERATTTADSSNYALQYVANHDVARRFPNASNQDRLALAETAQQNNEFRFNTIYVKLNQNAEGSRSLFTDIIDRIKRQQRITASADNLANAQADGNAAEMDRQARNFNQAVNERKQTDPDTATNSARTLGVAIQNTGQRRGYSAEMIRQNQDDAFRALEELGYSKQALDAVRMELGLSAAPPIPMSLTAPIQQQQLLIMLQQLREADEKEKEELKKRLENELRRNMEPEKAEMIALASIKKLEGGERPDYVAAGILAAQDNAVPAAVTVPAVYAFASANGFDKRRLPPDVQDHIANAQEFHGSVDDIQGVLRNPRFHQMYSDAEESRRQSAIMASVPVRSQSLHRERLEALVARNPADISTHSPVLQGLRLEAYLEALRRFSGAG